MAGIRRRGLFTAIVSLVVLFWLVDLAITVAVWLSGSADLTARWGQFGDAFGMANSLFSGVALIGAIAALALQRSDMEDSAQAQREAARSQIQHARVAALGAVLASKQFIIEHLREQLIKGPSATPILTNRKYDVAALADEIARELVQINELLDAELRQLIPEYRPETIRWPRAEDQQTGA
jgi:parvulin-like peptidyl-prolyl isomerase